MPRAKNLVSSPSRATGFQSRARENLCSSATTDTDFYEVIGATKGGVPRRFSLACRCSRNAW